MSTPRPRSTPMTIETRRAMRRTIFALHKRLLVELHGALEETYRFSEPDIDNAELGEPERECRRVIEQWIEGSLRELPKGHHKAERERLRNELVHCAIVNLLLRVVCGGQFEAFGLEDLAIDLPGLFGPRLTDLVPVPPASFSYVVETLDAPELQGMWLDDTTLGWVYQDWNTPKREALDAKVLAGGKIEDGREVASKTQFFTDRYLVEWLLQNSLGTMWLCMCRKHGWTADAEWKGVEGMSLLDQLDARRADWRGRRDRGEVTLDAPMPIDGEQEELWKYWVPQPFPQDAIDKAPESVRDIKLLDPAVGSGNFILSAFDMLFSLYEEEARHRGEVWSTEFIVDRILGHNLHGIDIDQNVVEVAAVGLVLKARERGVDGPLPPFNLVAPRLSQAMLEEDDPARVQFYEDLERDVGIPRVALSELVDSLWLMNTLGALLQVDRHLEEALDAWEAGRTKGAQLELGHRPMSRDDARVVLVKRVEELLAMHSVTSNLGVRFREEPVASGVRFMRMVRDGRYDLVVGNPPYLSLAKMKQAEAKAKKARRAADAVAEAG